MAWPDCVDHKQRGNRDGYGKTRGEDGRTVTLHRKIMEARLGYKLSSDVHVLHHCDNPRCINVNHFYLGSHLQNMQDKTYKRRGNTTKLRVSQYAEIRELWKSNNYTLEEIGKKFNVTRQRIHQIVHA